MILFLKGIQVSNKHSCASVVSFEIRRQNHDIYLLCVLIYIWNAVMPSWYWLWGSWQLKKTENWNEFLWPNWAEDFKSILTGYCFIFPQYSLSWMHQFFYKYECHKSKSNQILLYYFRKFFYLLHTITATK